jgi:hypothetical protein
MSAPEILVNIGLLCLCYFYVIAIIAVTGKINYCLPKSVSRKFLHIMIGNLIFIIPFFSFNVFPVNFPFFVAAPFIFLTFLVSKASPIKNISNKMSGLSDVTSGGHGFGFSSLCGFFHNFSFVIFNKTICYRSGHHTNGFRRCGGFVGGAKNWSPSI